MSVFTLILVRHGETAHNKSHIIQGQLDVPLSEVGVKQAKLLGAHLSQENFSHAYASDLSRAKQTAEEIIKVNKSFKSNVICDPRLRERKFGELQGKEFSLLKEHAQRAGMGVFAYCPPGGETLKELRQRCELFFKSLCHTIQGNHRNDTANGHNAAKENNPCDISESSNVLVVSHGGFILELMRHFFDDLHCEMSGKKNEVLRISPNSGLSKFRVSINEKGDLRRIDNLFVHNTSHLTDGASTSNIELSL